MRVALGITYSGQHYSGWQSQPSNQTIQDQLEIALNKLAGFSAGQRIIKTICSGRTDTGVHGLMQVVHFDTEVQRDEMAWVRGTNAHLPNDIAVQWCRFVPREFHARACSLSRRYRYILLESPVRPSLEAPYVGWCLTALDQAAMQAAAQHLLGEHDFSSFRAAACQALSPVKNIQRLEISCKEIAGATQARTMVTNGVGSISPKYWQFEFEANAFLHHMIRNIMATLIAVGNGNQDPSWVLDVLAAKNRSVAAPTFMPNGLYFAGPTYADKWQLPSQTPSFGWLPF